MKKLFFLIAASFFLTSVDAQITERERPAEWQHLVKGARFMDRFLPMPDGIQIKGIWGTDSVLNRYVDNGIELPGVSFWGYRALVSDGWGKLCIYASPTGFHIFPAKEVRRGYVPETYNLSIPRNFHGLIGCDKNK